MYFNIKDFKYLLFLITLISCSEADIPGLDSRTENLIILVIDGVRYSESGGDEQQEYLINIRENGVFFTNFQNAGITKTIPGHVAITSGVYQDINNSGTELPANPSIFQYFLKTRNEDSTKAWIITSKHKLAVLGNTVHPDWNGKYQPAVDSGTAGLGSENREDSATLQVALKVLKQFHPNIMMIHFKEPDVKAHANDWMGYIKAIEDTELFAEAIWDYLSTDPLYKSKTTFMVTNDHGRHLDGIQDGFISHGDNCNGCQHINLFIAGPEFKKDHIIETSYNLLNLTSTINELLNLEMDVSSGVITEAFSSN